MLLKTFRRGFSSAQLLVPLQGKQLPPSELEEGFSMTNAYFTNLQTSFDKYN